MTDQEIDYLNEFVTGYIECALWSSMDESDERGGDPLDRNYTADDLTVQARAQMEKDCRDFIDMVRATLEESKLSASQAGHNFWLTRNRHGTGFWDRGLGVVGTKLTELAHSFGEVDLYVGDDGRIYHT